MPQSTPHHLLQPALQRRRQQHRTHLEKNQPCLDTRLGAFLVSVFKQFCHQNAAMLAAFWKLWRAFEKIGGSYCALDFWTDLDESVPKLSIAFVRQVFKHNCCQACSRTFHAEGTCAMVRFCSQQEYNEHNQRIPILLAFRFCGTLIQSHHL